MSDSRHHHQRHHHNRPDRISIPPRSAASFTSRQYIPPSLYTPTPTPSKSGLFTTRPSTGGRGSLSFLILLLFSLRSLYSLFPLLRSSPPSFSLFPFSFLVSLLSFLLTFSFSLFSPSSKLSFYSSKLHTSPLFSLTSITPSQNRILAAKSLLLAVVFLLRFQALRFCGTAAMILAELSGNITARFLAEARARDFGYLGKDRSSRVGGFVALSLGLLFLALSWDRSMCFAFAGSSVGGWRFSLMPREDCLRVWPMLLPFLSGFLGCYERISMNSGALQGLGRKRVRLISLFYASVVLFIPAVISVLVFQRDGASVSLANLGWPLANTVIFGVLLSENYTDEKLASSKDFQREFLVTFGCTVVLELFYFPELSLWGLLLCGMLLYFAISELDPFYSSYAELGLESSEPFSAFIIKPIRHTLSERKSRKIALFLLINTGYMVVEFVVGFMSNSLGLISDACHMLFDCAALAIGLYASYISRLPANAQFNYGRQRFEVLSGYVNAVCLVLCGALIVLESIERILDPQEISTNSLLVVSIGGLLVNVIGLIFFHEEHHHAHGGSCSHSHSHSDSHFVHQHDHKHHNKSEKCISVGHDHHQCNKSNENTESMYARSGSFVSHSHKSHYPADSHFNGSCGCDHARLDGHNDHSHGQDHTHACDHKDHSHGHDHPHACDHSHGRDHAHACDHNDHSHGRDHAHACDHNDHSHGHDHAKSNYHHHKEIGLHHHFAEGHEISCLDHQSATTCEAHQINQPPIESGGKKHSHHHIDHNMEGIFLHVLADTMGSVGVVISTLLIKYKGWLVADPASSIFISILIVSSVIPLLRNSAEILLQRVPRSHEKDLFGALNKVAKMKQVRGVPHFHVWSLTNTEVVGTIHLHVETEYDKPSAKAQVSRVLHKAGIKDLTLQVECVKPA